jgi:hypothetical protein
LDKILVHIEFEFLVELRNVYIIILVFQAIKDVHIYPKSIQELCLKKIRRTRKGLHIVCVIGQLVDLMLGNIFMTKLVDLNNPVVDVNITTPSFETP